jgi:hypothetical protein
VSSLQRTPECHPTQSQLEKVIVAALGTNRTSRAGWTVQPEMQYIIRPGGGVLNSGDGLRPNALVIALRSTIRPHQANKFKTCCHIARLSKADEAIGCGARSSRPDRARISTSMRSPCHLGAAVRYFQQQREKYSNPGQPSD